MLCCAPQEWLNTSHVNFFWPFSTSLCWKFEENIPLIGTIFSPEIVESINIESFVLPSYFAYADLEQAAFLTLRSTKQHSTCIHWVSKPSLIQQLFTNGLFDKNGQQKVELQYFCLFAWIRITLVCPYFVDATQVKYSSFESLSMQLCLQWSGMLSFNPFRSSVHKQECVE